MTYRGSDTKAVVLRSAMGHLGAFETLVKRYYRGAFAYAQALLGDFHLAEDAVQESFLVAFQKLGTLRSPEKFPGWLRRIVHSRCTRIGRSTPKHELPFDDWRIGRNRYPGPEAEAEHAELTERIGRLIAALPPKQRAAAALCYIEGYAPHDVAEFLGMQASTLRKRLYDSRQNLKIRLQEEFPMNSESKNESMVRELFEKKIAPELLKRLLANPEMVNTAGEIRELTVMSADMVNFATLVDSMEPSRLVAYQNNFLSALSNAVLANGGFVDKIIGDEIMALWGTPANPENHAVRACRAAIAIQRATQASSEKWEAQGERATRITVGIHSGEAMMRRRSISCEAAPPSVGTDRA